MTTENSDIPPQGLQDQKLKEAYFTASQGQLIWARFKKQRSAMIAAAVLMFLVISGIFAPVLSPYDPTIAGRDKEYTNGAPQIPRFCDKNGCSIRPFIHPVERERSLATNFRWVTKINDEERNHVVFFPKGDDYKLFGFIPGIATFSVSKRARSTSSARTRTGRISSAGPCTPYGRRFRSAPSGCSSPLSWP